MYKSAHASRCLQVTTQPLQLRTPAVRTQRLSNSLQAIHQSINQQNILFPTREQPKRSNSLRSNQLQQPHMYTSAHASRCLQAATQPLRMPPLRTQRLSNSLHRDTAEPQQHSTQSPIANVSCN
jgi:hypothetical protein